MNSSALQHPSRGAHEKGRRDSDPVRDPTHGPQDPEPGPVIVCARAGGRFKCPLPGLPRVSGPVCRPPGSPLRVSCPERGTDRQGERPGSIAENPGLEVPKSGMETHRHTCKHMHALPEVDKNQPTNTKYRGYRGSRLTSCCREDQMPTPGHCHFHSAPGTRAPLALLFPDCSLEREMCPLASPRQLPTSQVWKRENNTSKTQSGGARTHREPQCAGDGGQDVPVTDRRVPGVLTAVPRGGSDQPACAP